jgi:hypothetical protein
MSGRRVTESPRAERRGGGARRRILGWARRLITGRLREAQDRKVAPTLLHARSLPTFAFRINAH